MCTLTTAPDTEGELPEHFYCDVLQLFLIRAINTPAFPTHTQTHTYPDTHTP